MKKSLLAVWLLSMFSVQAQNVYTVKVWAVQTAEGKANPMFEVPVPANKGRVTWGNFIYLQPQTHFQTIEGIGGAFNEMGGEALAALPKEEQKRLMKQLFSDAGAAFTFCRTAIGSSDFAFDAYSYSMVPNDFDLKHFSIERDKKYLLPFIQAALNVNPALTIFASPWSPPGWMKESGSMEGLKEPSNRIKNDPEIWKTYANYFVRYVQAYGEEGVHIDRICVQNENDANTKYPSCDFPAAEMIRFINSYLSPAFQQNGISTSIYAGTFRAVERMELIDFAEATGAGNIEGVGVQYTEPHVLADALRIRPGLKMFHTEGRCFNGENSPEQAFSRLEEVAAFLNAGCTTFTYWNMILNETTRSGWDWPQNSLVNIDRVNRTVRYNPDYNAMYLISRFVRPGDVRIAGFHRGKAPFIALRAPNGQLKLLLSNGENSRQLYELSIEGQRMKVALPPQSIGAVVIEAKGN